MNDEVLLDAVNRIALYVYIYAKLNRNIFMQWGIGRWWGEGKEKWNWAHFTWEKYV